MILGELGTEFYYFLDFKVIMGTPLRYAKKLGVDTPVLETVYTCVAAIDAKIAGRIKALV